jgi:hypothetical protein
MGVEVKSGGEGVIVAAAVVMMVAVVMDAIQAGAPVGVQSVVHW